MGDGDEDLARLNAAVKADDSFFTTFFVSPYSKYVARWAAGRGLSPNQVTVVSMLLGVCAALAFASGTRAGLIVGAILLQAAFTADCVDGQLARYTGNFSALGAWLDSVFDRGKEYLVYAGLAAGAAPLGQDGQVWLLAVAALALQSARHALHFSYNAWEPTTALREAMGDQPVGRHLAGPLSRAGVSRYADDRSWTRWAKRAVILPIGERFALISFTAAVWGPRTTFVALLTWGVVATAYAGTGRVLRSIA